MSRLFTQHLASIYSEEIYVIDSLSNTKKEVSEAESKKEEQIVTNAQPEPKSLFILILAKGKNQEHPNTHELLFLNKILRSVSLTSDDVKIINDAKEYIFLKDNNERSSFIVISFGIDVHGLDKNFSGEKYILQSHYLTKYLYVDALYILEGDIEKKKLLWKALKSVF